MKKLTTVLVLLSALCLAGGRASGQNAPPPAAALGDNAALRYWLAFAVMPQWTPEQDAIVANWEVAALDGTAKAVLDQGAEALDLLQRAGELKQCDWGLVADGPQTLMPHLAKARQLARLAALRIRYRLHQGDETGAVTDTLALLTLSRHLASHRCMIELLVEQDIEQKAINAMAENLKRLHREALQQLDKGLGGLPEPGSFRDAVFSERDDMFKWFAERLRSGDSRAAKMFAETMGITQENNLNAKDDAAARTPVENYIHELERMQRFYSQWAEMGSLPLETFDRQAPVLVEKMKKDCPLVATHFVSDLPKLRHEEAHAQAQRAMFKAAIAVAMEGPEKLQAFKDPFGEGPFEYREIGNGFQLKSKLLYRDAGEGLTVSVAP